MVSKDTTVRRVRAVSALVCGLAFTLPAAAQEAGGAPAPRPMVSRNAPPSPNSTINLINLLVKQGVITEEQAQALIKQADEEAYVARQAVRDAATKAEAAKTSATTAIEATSPPGTKRVAYVPEIVKKQIREDIRREVMDKAKAEGWAAPGTFPEWVSRIRFSGDVRARYEAITYPNGNDPYRAVNYNAINTGSPYDTSDINSNLWPTYNTDEERSRARLRARLGMEADLYDGFTAGIRIATGDTNAPVSFNQTLGGSGGNFSKYSVWLDRAFINYRPTQDISMSVGRFDNPFFHPTDLVYHRDLGFDGVAAKVKYEVSPGVVPFLVAGAFPLYNTALDVGRSVSYIAGQSLISKYQSNDKWMFGVQGGGAIRLVPDVELTVGAAYYDFYNVTGALSSPCYVYTSSDLCDTDLTRPSFAQKGNSYMALRNIVPTSANNFGQEAQYQYFGLASSFRDVVLSGRLDLGHFHPVHVVLDGEYVQNIAWNWQDINAKVLANPIPGGPLTSCPTVDPCPQFYAGGNIGWLGRMTVGYRDIKEFGDWNFFVGYKYLESDAVIDAFTDSDFGLGGTNLKGYFVGANLGLGRNVWASARWMSANQVAGAPYAVDVLQVDLNARF